MLFSETSWNTRIPMSFQPLAGISEGVRALRPRSGSLSATRRASAPAWDGDGLRVGSAGIPRAGAAPPARRGSATKPRSAVARATVQIVEFLVSVVLGTVDRSRGDVIDRL